MAERTAWTITSQNGWWSTFDGAHEHRELDRRELYVGITRARDGLWVGVRG